MDLFGSLDTVQSVDILYTCRISRKSDTNKAGALDRAIVLSH